MRQQIPIRRLLPVLLALLPVACRATDPPALALGSPAPGFSLPGVDGKTHALADYAGSKVLAVVFTGNSCAASQLYEARLRALADDYRNKGVALVAINPNQPSAMQPADLAYSDVGETLDDMKTRAVHRRLSYPYLSDGDTQSVARQFKVQATPHVFVFDQSRTLRYEGRIDDHTQPEEVKSSDARNAIDALLNDRSVPLARTSVVGCAVRGLAGPVDAPAQAVKAEKDTIAVEMVGADDLKRLRQNGTGKLLLVNFWATWCAPCVAEFPELERTYRMYKPRNLEFASVSVNDPEEKAAVVEFLQSNRASHRTVQFATSDVYGLQAAFDPKMPAAVPFTLLLAANGDVVHQELGELDVLKLRRAILANLPEDPKYPGHRAYWSTPDR
jgi:thiol-disulfide isomerase/thioredoxin